MNCLLLGNGRWGKKLAKNLGKVAIIKKKINSSVDYKKIKLNNIDWTFISTPNNLHYQHAKYFLENKINVFCEKPLALKYKEAKELVKLSIKNSVNLYIDDIESYKKKNLHISKKKNLIFRSKSNNYNFQEVLNSLFYHDFYLLKKNISLKSLKINILEDSKLKKKFLISSNKKEFLFEYNCHKTKKHFINKINYISKKNYIKTMITCVLNEKFDLKENHKKALFCCLLIDMILKKYKKNKNAY